MNQQQQLKPAVVCQAPVTPFQTPELGDSQGVLILHHHKLEFALSGYSNPPLSIKLTNIKKFQIVTKIETKMILCIISRGDEKVFKFDFGAGNKEQFDNFVTKLNIEHTAISQKITMKMMDKPGISKEDAMLQIQERDEGFKQLHQHLVEKKIITEEEFRERYNSILEDFTHKSEFQSMGLLSQIEKLRTYATGKQKTLVQSQNYVQEMLATHPFLKEAYRDLVPDKMSDEDFWNYQPYHEEEYAAEYSSNPEAVKKMQLFNPYVERDRNLKKSMKTMMFKGLRPSDQLETATKLTTSAALTEEQLEKQRKSGTIQHQLHEAQKRVDKIMDEYNWHGLCALYPDALEADSGNVMEVINSNNKRAMVESTAACEVAPLKIDTPQNAIPLSVPPKQHPNQPTNANETTNVREQLAGMLKGSDIWNCKSDRVNTDPKLGREILCAFSEDSIQSTARESAETIKTLNTFKRPLKMLTLQVKECLFFFWKYVKMDNGVKLDKVVKKIHELQSTVQNIGEGEYTVCKPRLLPIEKMLNIAIEVYKERERTHNARKEGEAMLQAPLVLKLPGGSSRSNGMFPKTTTTTTTTTTLETSAAKKPRI